MKYFKYYLLLLALVCTHPAQAGLGSWMKKGVKAIVKNIPGVGKLVEEDEKERLIEKVDHIKEKQKTGIEKLQDIAKKAMKTKEKVEEMYYFKEQSKRRAEDLVQELKRGKKKNFLGALVENWIGIPINPAAYIPDTAYTRDLKKNLELDLSSERGLVQEHEYFLRGTRAELLDQDLRNKNPKQFNQAYDKALRYEREIEKALSAKKQATIKLYKEDIANLEKEIAVLENTKKKKGLTIGDVMQIEIATDNKRHIIRSLNEKITDGLQEEMKLTDEQQAILGNQKAQKDTEELTNFLKKERTKIHTQYSHLWKFW